MGTAKIYVNELSARLREGAQRAGKMLAEQIMADERPFVPKQEGTLRDSARIEQGEDATELVYDTPYAAYQYYGCWPDGSHAVRNHTTPGTYTQWHERAKRQYKKAWADVYSNAFKEGMG